MRPLNAKARFLFCSLGFTLLYGCTMILDLGDKHFEDTAGSGSNSSSGTISSSSGGGGAANDAGPDGFVYTMGEETSAPAASWFATLDSDSNLSNAVNIAGAVTQQSTGDVFTAGDFIGELTITGGNEMSSIKKVGSMTLSSSFIAKFQADGKRVWSHAMTSSNNVMVRDIAVSNKHASIVVVGTLNGPLIDESLTTICATTGIGTHLFIMKVGMDGSACSCQTFGNAPVDSGLTGGVEAAGVEIDDAGNIYVAATFEDSFYTPPSTLASKGGKDGAVLKIIPNMDCAQKNNIGTLEVVLPVASMGDDQINDMKLNAEGSHLAITGSAGPGFTVGMSSPLIKMDERAAYAALIQTNFKPTTLPLVTVSDAIGANTSMESRSTLVLGGGPTELVVFSGGSYINSFTWLSAMSGTTTGTDQASFLIRFPQDSSGFHPPNPLFWYGITAMGKTSSDSDSIYDLAADPNSTTVFLAGTFSDPFYLPGGQTHTPESGAVSQNAYIAMTNPLLDDAKWVKTFGPGTGEFGQQINHLFYHSGQGGSGALFATGKYTDTFNLDGQPIPFQIKSQRAFVMKIDLAGQ